MNVVLLQGINHGVGTSSIGAAISWALGVHNYTTLFVNAADENCQYCTDALMGIKSDNSSIKGWTDYISKENVNQDLNLYQCADKCFYLPYGTGHGSVTAKDSVKSIIHRISELNKLDFVIVDGGVRSSTMAKAFCSFCDLCISVTLADANCMLRLNETTPYDHEYFLINRFMMKSTVMNSIELLLRKSPLGKNFFNYVIQYDESMNRAFMEMMPVTRFLPIASSAKNIEKLMVDLILIEDLINGRKEQEEEV